MGEIILKNAVKGKLGYRYYVDKEGNICRSKMRKVKVKKEKFINYFRRTKLYPPPY